MPSSTRFVSAVVFKLLFLQDFVISSTLAKEKLHSSFKIKESFAGRHGFNSHATGIDITSADAEKGFYQNVETDNDGLKANQQPLNYHDNYDMVEQQLRKEISIDDADSVENRNERSSFFSRVHQGCWGGSAASKPFVLKTFRDGNLNSLCAQYCSRAGYNVASTRGTLCGCSYGFPNPIITRGEVESYMHVCNYSCPGSRSYMLGRKCDHDECCGGPYGYTVLLVGNIDTTKHMMLGAWNAVRERIWTVTQIQRIGRAIVFDDIITKRSANEKNHVEDKLAEFDDTSETAHHRQIVKRALCLQSCGEHGHCGTDDVGQSVCVCDFRWGGTDCSHECLKDCTGHGKCNIDTFGKHYCVCDSGWEGDHCEIQNCFKLCFNRGTCITIGEQPMCECRPGWTHHDCSKKCLKQCKHNGNCIIEADSEVCNCVAGWGGDDCSKPCDKFCHNEGHCRLTAEKQVCMCRPMYAGPLCERSIRYGVFCPPENDVTEVIQPEMTCPKNTAIRVISAQLTRNSPDVCTSQCQRSADINIDLSNIDINIGKRKRRFANPGFVACNLCEKPSTNLTLVNITCYNMPSCTLPFGSDIFKRSFDLNACSSVNKYVELQYDCVPDHLWKNPCDANPCENDGSCFGDTDTQSYTCVCTNGWTGGRCSISPVDPCVTSNGCMNGGTCLPDRVQQTYKCICPTGYTGTLCDIPPGSIEIELRKKRVLASCFPSAMKVESLCRRGEEGKTCWTHFPNMTMNEQQAKKSFDGLNVEKCKAACLYETSFDCASIEYRDNQCWLLILSRATAENTFGFASFITDYYERVSCSEQGAQLKRAISVAQKVVCNPGWTVVGKKCYKVSDTTGSFESAKLQCQADMAEFASIESERAENEIQKIMNDRNIDKLWIALENPTSSMVLNIDGSSVIYNTDNSEVYDSDEEKCIQISFIAKLNGADIWQWLDSDCSRKFHFLCRSDPPTAIKIGQDTCSHDLRGLGRLRRICDGKKSCSVEPDRLIAAEDTIYVPHKETDMPEKYCWERIARKRSKKHMKLLKKTSGFECRFACESDGNCKSYSVDGVKNTCKLSNHDRYHDSDKFQFHKDSTYYGKIPCITCWENHKGKTIPKDYYRSKWTKNIKDTRLAQCHEQCKKESNCKALTYYPGVGKCTMIDVNMAMLDDGLVDDSVSHAIYSEPQICTRLVMHYSCSNVHQSVTCSNSTIKAVCHEGVINMEEAWYGRLDYNVCPNKAATITDCYLGITERLKDYCNDEQTCSITPELLDLGWIDPCLGTDKYIVARYECVVQSDANNVHCPENYKYVPSMGSCYKVVKEEVEWYIAKDKCWQDGFNAATSEMKGSLASLSTSGEQNAISLLLEEACDQSEVRARFWIGLTDEVEERQQMRDRWQWLNGEAYMKTWTFWSSSEPRGGEDKDHVLVKRDDSWHWFNVKNELVRAYYVCEYKLALNPCKAGYIYHAYFRACYKVIPGRKSWKEAEQSCYNEQAFLASILSPFEQRFVLDLTRFMVNTYVKEFWVGAIGFGSKWVWTDQSDFDWNLLGIKNVNNEKKTKIEILDYVKKKEQEAMSGIENVQNSSNGDIPTENVTAFNPDANYTTENATTPAANFVENLGSITTPTTPTKPPTTTEIPKTKTDCTYINLQNNGAWVKSDCSSNKTYTICKYRPPYVEAISMEILINMDDESLQWQRCTYAEYKSQVVFFCGVIQRPTSKRFAYLTLVDTTREVDFKFGKSLTPLGAYDFMLENPTYLTQLLYREFELSKTSSKTVSVESGQTIASTVSKKFTEYTTKGKTSSLQGLFNFQAGKKAQMTSLADMVAGIKVDVEWGAKKKDEVTKAKSYGFSEQTINSFKTGRSRTDSVTITESFAVFLKIPPRCLGQVNLFKEVYPLELKWKALFYLEGFLTVTWRIHDYTITKQVDVVQLMVHELRKLYAVGSASSGERERIVAMIMIKRLNNDGILQESRPMTDKEIKERPLTRQQSQGNPKASRKRRNFVWQDSAGHIHHRSHAKPVSARIKH